MQKYYINLLSPYTHNICIGAFYNWRREGDLNPLLHFNKPLITKSFTAYKKLLLEIFWEFEYRL